MQRLCNRRISYYFAAITPLTAKMARIMQECYVHSHNAEFKVSNVLTAWLQLWFDTLHCIVATARAFSTEH